MNIKTANKIITEFMGGPYVGDACMDSFGVNDGLDHCTDSEICSRCEVIAEGFYTSSLDNLLPAFRKLQKCIEEVEDTGNYLDFTFTLDDKNVGDLFCIDSNWGYIETVGEGHISYSLTEEAAVATARAIEKYKQYTSIESEL